MRAHRRLRSACASAQSDQSLRFVLNVSLVDSEDSDQTWQMPRLICFFAGRMCHFVSFVVLRLTSWLLVS